MLQWILVQVHWKKTPINVANCEFLGGFVAHFPSPMSSECQDVNLKLKPHLNILYKELYSVAPRWRDIGLFLDLDLNELDLVADEGGVSTRNLERMLSLWLMQIDPFPTKSKIIGVLRRLKLNDEAERLEKMQ